MDHPQGVLRTGDRATVQFEFISHPEFVKVGMKLLFREGKTKVKSICRIPGMSAQGFTGIGCNNTVDLSGSASGFSIFRCAIGAFLV
jgi:hypothetical protein